MPGYCLWAVAQEIVLVKLNPKLADPCLRLRVKNLKGFLLNIPNPLLQLNRLTLSPTKRMAGFVIQVL